MRDLLKQITDDTHLWPIIHAHITREWPQINHATKVQHSGQTALIVTDYHETRIFENVKRQRVHGWTLFQHACMYATLDRLDDPDERMKYHRWMFNRLFNAIRLTFWWVIGNVFKREDWYNRCTILVPNPIHPPLQRRLEWKHFQRHSGMFHRDEMMSFTYDGLHDTLYIFNYGGGR